ncbi:MAG: DUF1467 family protein [Proteobacteria bacterium]|nr:DUF1467 family protein [Pseudomonadota bacterium]
MGWASGIALYVIIWWTVIFTVLPWGATPPAEPGRGHATSAPERPRIAFKALITTGIASVIWLAIYLIVRADIISFRRMVQ